MGAGQGVRSRWEPLGSGPGVFFPEGLNDGKSVFLECCGEWTGEGRLHQDDRVLRVDEDEVVCESDNFALCGCLDGDDSEYCRFTVEVILLLRLNLGTELQASLLKSVDPCGEGSLQIRFSAFLYTKLVGGKGALSRGGIVLKDGGRIALAWGLLPSGRDLD